MGKKSNNISLHLGQNKTWMSSWCTSIKEYSGVFQNDMLLYAYIRAFLVEKKNSNIDILGLRLYKTNNVIIIDLNLLTFKLLNKKLILNIITNLNNFYNNKYFFFLALKKLTLSKAITQASYVSFKIAKLIENGVRFRSKIVKLFLKQIQKNCKGVYVLCTGRINNVDMARTDRLYVGSIPLQNVAIFLDYNMAIANTKKGLQSIKVWINQ